MMFTFTLHAYVGDGSQVFAVVKRGRFTSIGSYILL